MTTVQLESRVRVIGEGIWCRGAEGKIVGQSADGLWLVKLDNYTARELRFLESELEGLPNVAN